MLARGSALLQGVDDKDDKSVMVLGHLSAFMSAYGGGAQVYYANRRWTVVSIDGRFVASYDQGSALAPMLRQIEQWREGLARAG